MTDDEKRMEGLLRAARMPSAADEVLAATALQPRTSEEEQTLREYQDEVLRAQDDLNRFNAMPALNEADMAWMKQRIAQAQQQPDDARRAFVLSTPDAYKAEHGRELPPSMQFRLMMAV